MRKHIRASVIRVPQGNNCGAPNLRKCCFPSVWYATWEQDLNNKDALFLLLAHRECMNKAMAEGLLALLPAKEAKNIQRSRRPEDRHLRLLARLLLARGMEQLEGRASADTLAALCADEAGCPRLSDSHRVFSLSHSADLAACLIGLAARHGRVGVDVEARRDLRLEEIAPVFCAAERRHLANAPERLFEWWTKKEAILKANGSGFLHMPEAVDLTAPVPFPPMPTLWVNAIWLTDFPAYHCAIAAERGPASVCIQICAPQTENGAPM
jgi:phosphopantetheinyl transferase